MDTAIIVALIVAALVIGGLVGWLITRQRRSSHLRKQFGPEYRTTVDQIGDRKKAEEELARREQRVRGLSIQPLPNELRNRYAEDWRIIQARFVDKPARAVADADALITEALQKQGYPMGDFEQRASDISVDHPQVVDHYRKAHELALRSEEGRASTEDLRQAMVHYRALFEDLLDRNVIPDLQTSR